MSSQGLRKPEILRKLFLQTIQDTQTEEYAVERNSRFAPGNHQKASQKDGDSSTALGCPFPAWKQTSYIIQLLLPVTKVNNTEKVFYIKLKTKDKEFSWT